MPSLSRIGYFLLVVSIAVGLVGGVSSQFVSWAEWPVLRWVTWFCLIVFAAVTVVGWWRTAPPPAAPSDAAGHRPAPNDPQPVAPPDSTGTTIVTRFLSRVAEPIFGWLAAYPLFPLPFLFFWLVSWAGLGDGFGFPDLVWYETWWPRFWAGLSVALLFGNLLFVRYLLDDRPGSYPSRFFGERWSLFWFVQPSAEEIATAARVEEARIATREAEQVAHEAVQAALADPSDAAWEAADASAADREDARIDEWLTIRDDGAAEAEAAGKEKVRRLGAFLLWVWPATLLVFLLPKLWVAVRGEVQVNGAMTAGLAAAVGLTLGLLCGYSRRGSGRGGGRTNSSEHYPGSPQQTSVTDSRTPTGTYTALLR
jgi:hypothetical protein